MVAYNLQRNGIQLDFNVQKVDPFLIHFLILEEPPFFGCSIVDIYTMGYFEIFEFCLKPIVQNYHP